MVKLFSLASLLLQTDTVIKGFVLRQISATLLHGCIGQGSRLLPRIRSLERIRDSRVNHFVHGPGYLR
jgi:hypothetical protein